MKDNNDINKVEEIELLQKSTGESLEKEEKDQLKRSPKAIPEKINKTLDKL